MKTSRAALLLVSALLMLSFAAVASHAKLPVLVAPDSAEAALIEEAGYLPVYSNAGLQAAAADYCAIAVGRSGYALADWDSVLDQVYAGSAMLIGFGWDVEEVLDGLPQSPVAVPGLISGLFVDGDVMDAFAFDDYEDLNWTLDAVCFFVQMNEMGFDGDEFGMLTPEMVELMLAEFLPQIEPFLEFLDHFLQPKWDYKVVTIDKATVANDAGFEQALNDLGAEGWELVSLNNGQLVFKRLSMDAESWMHIMIDFVLSVMEDNAELFDLL